ATVLGDGRDRALLFKQLATLRTDAPLFRDVDELRWRGPTDDFAARAERLGDPRLLSRCTAIRETNHRMSAAWPHRTSARSGPAGPRACSACCASARPSA